MNSVGLTSRWVAASRAAETQLPNRLFDDPLAHDLAGPEGFALLEQFSQLKPLPATAGPDSYFSIRTRFLDDEILKAAKERFLKQVVIFAAGMDARAFRLEWPGETTFFEIDQAAVLDYKEDILSRKKARPRGKRKIIRVDLAQPWADSLLATGFDPNLPAAFLVEGLLVYLTAEDVDRFLATVGELAAPGSWLGADLPNPELLSSPYMKPLVTAMETFGSAWKFGINNPEAFFAERGWTAKSVAVGEWEANYGRWPYPVMPRDMPGIPRTFLVSALRT